MDILVTGGFPLITFPLYPITSHLYLPPRYCTSSPPLNSVGVALGGVAFGDIAIGAIAFVATAFGVIAIGVVFGGVAM